MSPRPNATVDQILDITFDLIAEHDVSGVTVDMVAARASVSKATIYRRWATRAALLTDAMTRLRRPTMTPDSGSLRDDLIFLLNDLVALLNRRGTSRVLASFLNAAARDPELSSLQQAISSDARSAYEHVIRRAIARGDLAPDVDARLMIDMLLGPFLYQSVVEHARVRPGDVECVVEVVVSAFEAARVDA